MLWHRTGGLGLGLVTSPISAPISAPYRGTRHSCCSDTRAAHRGHLGASVARLKFGGPQASSGGSLPVGKVRRSVPALVPGRGIDARNGFRGLRIGQHTTDPLRRRPCPPRPRAVGCVRGSSVSRTASRSRQSLQRVAPSACARGSHQRSAGGGAPGPIFWVARAQRLVSPSASGQEPSSSRREAKPGTPSRVPASDPRRGDAASIGLRLGVLRARSHPPAEELRSLHVERAVAPARGLRPLVALLHRCSRQRSARNRPFLYGDPYPGRARGRRSDAGELFQEGSGAPHLLKP